MAQTMQPCSRAFFNNDGGKDSTINKPEAENNISLLLSIFDGLNTLYERLSRLEYVLERKNLEHILHRKEKERRNENQF